MNNNPNILFISFDGLSDPLGQSQILPYLFGLSKNYNITVISCEKIERLEKEKENLSSLLKSTNINWEYIYFEENTNLYSKYIYLKSLKQIAQNQIKKHNIKLIHCRSYPAANLALYFKKKLNIPFVFDMRGFWADERVDGKLWNLKNPIFKYIYDYFKKKEKEFLLTATAVVCLTEKAKEEMLSWDYMSNYLKEITVIPCCADLNVFNKDNIEEFRLQSLKAELKITNDDYVLMYLGSIGTWYMLDEMIEFFSVLKQQKPQSKFLFITKDEHQRILDVAEKHNVKEDIILRSGTRAEVPYLISVSNCSIFFILASYSKMASSPTKQAEIMAMGIPIICNKNIGDTDMLIKKYHSGFIVNDFTDASYADTANSIFEKNNFNKEETINGAKQYFSLSKGIEKFKKIYDAVN